MVKSSGESQLTVAVAFGANLAIAGAKTFAAFLTGSASMTAEAAHSWADTGNEVFLMIANRRSSRKADRTRPLGYGREAYVWSLLAALGLFVVGGSLSVWHGISEIVGGTERGGADYLVAYIVLSVAFVLEGGSLIQAVRQLRNEAKEFDRDLFEHAMATSDPTTRAVFAEDSAAVLGVVIALLGIGLHELTGNVMYDAAGSIAVGLLLGAVAVVLIERNRDFLTGEAGPPQLRQGAVDRLREFPEVASVRYLRLEFIGPKQLFVVASVDLEGDHVESSIAHTLRNLEHRLEEHPYIAEAVLTVSDPDDEYI